MEPALSPAMLRKSELGEYPIGSDRFTLLLRIPADTGPAAIGLPLNEEGKAPR
jgi:hypothetical protein